MTSSAEASRRTGGRHRALTVLAALVALVLVIAATWWLAQRAQSPAQREAAAAPPSPAAVTVAVRTGDLRDEVTANATVTATGERTLPLPARSDADVSVVTATQLQAGQQVAAGSVLLRVNSRPVIVLQGDFAPYRDLYTGDEGDDVRELQEALVSLGYSLTPDGVLGPGTAQCVRDLYRQLETSPPTSTTPATTSQETSTSTTTDTESSREGDAGTSGGSDAAATDGERSAQTPARTLVLPRAEVLMVPELTAATTLSRLPAVGTTFGEDPVDVVLSSGSRQVTAELPATVAESLEPGTTTARTTIAGTDVDLTLTSLTAQEAATDSSTADGGTSEGTGSGPVGTTFDAVFSTDSDALAALPPGDETTLLLTIARSATISDTLLVPERAVVRSGTGAATVLKKTADGSFSALPVEVTGCVGGTCAVSSDGLAEGDAVRVDGP